MNDQNMQISSSSIQSNGSAGQSRREEKINSLTHAIMAGILLTATPAVFWFLSQSRPDNSLKDIFGVAVFILCLLVMFTTSAVYHGLPAGSRYKMLWKRLDHMAIFLTIAGSYTPIALSTIGGRTGWIIFAIEWILVLAGIIFKTVYFKLNKITWVISVALYLLMGWAVVLWMPSLLATARTANLWLIISGGLLYTIGVVFFAQKWRYAHVVWHGFVIAGAASHFVAIIFFLH